MSGHKVHVTFIVKPDCHLCDEARVVLDRVVATLTAEGLNITVSEHNILEDAQLRAAYQEDIPVVLIDGKRHSYWAIDPDRLTGALRKRSRGPIRGLFTRGD